MDKIVFYISVCLALTGCCNKHSEYVLVQNNDYLIFFNNYDFATFEFPFTSFENYPISSEFSLDVKEQKNKIPCAGKDSLLIVEIIRNFNDTYYEYEHERVSQSDTHIDVYFCGKLSFVDSIISFLFSEEIQFYDFDYSGIPLRYLYLLNFKKDKLASIIQLSVNMSYDNSISSVVTYLMDYLKPHMYFSRIDYYYLDDPDRYISIEKYLPAKMIGEYVKINKELKVLHFSTFIIDENGFIKPINI